jgi:hypothetical protein
MQLVSQPLFGLLCSAWMMDDGVCGAMKVVTGRENRSTRGIPDPVPLFLPQIPRDLIWAPMRAAAVGDKRLTA